MKFFFLIVCLFSATIAMAVDDPQIKRPFKLPAGVTSRDYFPNKLIIKFKPHTSKAVSTFSVYREIENLNLKLITITGLKQVFTTGLSTEIRASKSKSLNSLDRIFEVTFTAKRSIE